MRVLGLVTKYFLMLMVIEGVVVAFIDSKNFKKANMKSAAHKARRIGILTMIFSVILYLLQMYIA